MPRSEITIDLGALRHNVRRLLDALAGSQLWAVVKADAYGHGAVEVARVALEEGASALCVATVGEGVGLRSALPDTRIIVMGPTRDAEIDEARDAHLELAVSEPPFPEGVPLHLKLDTGMGRFGARRLSEPPPNAVGLMTHLATADMDPAFAERSAGALSRGGCRTARARRTHREQRRNAYGCVRSAASRRRVAGSRSSGFRRSRSSRPRTASSPSCRGGARSHR